jgi:hypothetical protein
MLSTPCHSRNKMRQFDSYDSSRPSDNLASQINCDCSFSVTHTRTRIRRSCRGCFTGWRIIRLHGLSSHLEDLEGSSYRRLGCNWPQVREMNALLSAARIIAARISPSPVTKIISAWCFSLPTVIWLCRAPRTRAYACGRRRSCTLLKPSSPRRFCHQYDFFTRQCCSNFRIDRHVHSNVGLQDQKSRWTNMWP